MATSEEPEAIMKTLKDLNLSKEEVERLTKAMKDPKFQSMFADYAKEISNPAVKAEFERQITQSEGGNGKGFSMEGKDLLIPYSDFCIKTRNSQTGQKVFINLCHSERVANPIAIDDPIRHGTQWEIPYSLGPPHQDKDKTGKGCEVNDFIVGTEAHERARDNKRFKEFLIVTSLEAIEKQRKIELDRRYSLPHLAYKGVNGSKETRIFTVPKEKRDGVSMALRSRSSSPFKFDRENKNSRPASPPKADKKNTNVENGDKTSGKSPHTIGPNAMGIDEGVTIEYPKGWFEEVEPKFEMVYRSTVDYGDYWEDNKNLNPEQEVPKEILVRIKLPKVVNALDIMVDLEERRVLLRVPGKYRLKTQLRYTVDESRGRAQWDKNKHQLNITLPVIIAPKNKEPPVQTM